MIKSRIRTITLCIILALAIVMTCAMLVACDKNETPTPDGQIKPAPDEKNEPTVYSVAYAGVDNAINPNAAIKSYVVGCDDIPLSDAIKTGYTFNGWKYNDQVVTAIKSEWNSNVTLTATWTANHYSINYAGLEGGTNPNADKTSYTVENNKIALPAAEREGYQFAGWTYNDRTVTEIDPSWASDVTLVANWGEHVCHIELEWDLPEQYRFYFLGEPYAIGFYVNGDYVQVAPKVYLVYGEDSDKKIFIPYYNGICLAMTGFDSMTAGTKHVTIEVRNINRPEGGVFPSVTKSFDVEVKDYDHDHYGFSTQPTDANVTYPEGYGFDATLKNAGDVIAYNWCDVVVEDEMDERCSHQNYNPYNLLTGATGFTSSLEVPYSYETDSEHYRLIAIYGDMTRVYSNIVTANISDAPSGAARENWARLGEVVFGPDSTRGGVPFDLADYGIGSGTISFVKNVNGAEFTFNNVNFVNDSYVCDAFNSSAGFQYFYTNMNGAYAIHLVGDNYFTNTYYFQKAAGIAVNFQNIEQNLLHDIVNESTLIIDGSGSLNCTGGAPSIYANADLTIDAKLSFASYVGRPGGGLIANYILMTDNARVNATNSGYVFNTMVGGMQIDSGAKLNALLTMPRKEGTVDAITAMTIAGTVQIDSADVSISVIAAPEIYQPIDGSVEGIQTCSIISAYGAIIINGSNVDLKIIASNSPSTAPYFESACALAATAVYVTDSYLTIDLQTDLFHSVYGIAANNTINIDNSFVYLYIKALNEMNGINCPEGNVEIINNSNVTVKGITAYVDEEPMFGVYSGSSTPSIVVNDSRLAVDFNRGYAVAAYLGMVQLVPAHYDEGYTPTALEGFVEDSDHGLSAVSKMAGVDPNDGIMKFHYFETVYDLTGDNPAPAKRITVDNT